MSSAPPTPTREQLRQIWCQLLELDLVGDDDNFFLLSGKSIDAVRLVNRIRSAFGLEVTIRTVFEAPTVAQLEAALRTAPPAPEPLRPGRR